MARRLAIVTFVLITIVASSLAVMTFVRTVGSQRALTGLNLHFVDLRPGEYPRDFKVEMEFVNGGEVTTRVESLSVLLRFEGKLIARRQWVPDELEIAPGGVDSITLLVRSNLEEESLPLPEQVLNSDAWSIRTTILVSHPVREGAVILQRQRSLRR